MIWYHVLGFFSDIHTVVGGIAAVVGFGMQILIFRKQIKADKGIQRNEKALSLLTAAVDEDIRKQIAELRKTSAHIDKTATHLEELYERRIAQTASHPGRRAGEAMRAPRPIVVPLVHDPKDGVSGWPIP